MVLMYNNRRLVLPGAVASVEVNLTGNRPGSYSLLVSMFCDQLTDVRGHAQVTVAPPG